VSPRRLLTSCAVLLVVGLGSPPTSAAGSQAEALMFSGRVEEALVVAREEALAAPGDLDAQERYIDLLLSVGLPDVAQRTFRARLEDHPTDADAHYLLGRSVTTAEEATASYRRALQLDPDHARSYMGLAAVQRTVGTNREAEAGYRRAVELDPTLGEAWVGLQAVLVVEGRPDEALQVARRAVQALPGEADSYLAISLLAPEEALDTLRTAVDRAGHDPRTHSALGEELLLVPDPAGARAAALRALAIDPALAEPQLTVLFANEMASGDLDLEGYRALVGARRLEAHDPPAALRAYQDLVARYPHTPLTWMARARVRTSLGASAGAESDLRQALLLDPGNVEASAALGLLLHRADRSAEAAPLLNTAAAGRPGDASLAIAAAEALAATGAWDEGLVHLERASSLHPRDVRVILARAKLSSEHGDLEGAYAVLRDALPAVPDVRLVIALAAAARDLGRLEEAAALLEDLGRQSGEQAFIDMAARLRASAP